MKKFVLLCLGCFANKLIADCLLVNLTIDQHNIKQLIIDDLSIYKHNKQQDLSVDKIKFLYSQVKQEVFAALQALGYYLPKINANLQQQGSTWSVNINILTGAAITLQETKLILTGPGSYDTILTSNLQMQALPNGKTITHAQYISYQQNILQQLQQYGYFSAVVEQQQLEIDREKQQAIIFTKIHTNNKYCIGNITFKKPPYPKSFLNKFIILKKNQYYYFDDLQKNKYILQNSNLFEKIALNSSVNEQGNKVDIDIHLSPKAKNKISGSLDYSSDLRFKHNLEWQHYFTSFPGHIINNSLQVSNFSKSFSINYEYPGTTPYQSQYTIYADLNYSCLTNYKFEKNLTWQHNYNNNNVVTITKLSFYSEDYKIKKTDPWLNGYFMVPELCWVFNNHITTNWLHNTEFSIKAANRRVFSTQSFIQLDLSSYHCYKINKSSFFLNTKFGVNSNLSQKLPLRFRYFAGGDNSVRGYAYQGLGPFIIDELGNKKFIGGQFLIFSSVEYSYSLTSQLRASIFVDAGNAFDMSFTPAISAGIGVAYRTQVGTLKLDVAKPVNPKRNAVRLHFRFLANALFL